MVDNQRPDNASPDPDNLGINPAEHPQGGQRPDRGGHAEGRTQDPNAQSEEDTGFSTWFGGLEPDAKSYIESHGVKGDFEQFFHLAEASSLADINPEEAQAVAERVYQAMEEYPPLKEALGRPEGAEEGPTWWDLLEASRKSREELEATELPEELSEDRVTENNNWVNNMMNEMQESMRHPEDAARVDKVKHELEHLREADGKLAQELQKGSSALYKVFVPIMIVFLIYCGMVSGMSAAVKKFGEGSK